MTHSTDVADRGRTAALPAPMMLPLFASAVSLALLALLAFLPSLLPAQSQRFTLEQALSYPFPYGLTAAARGERVAWVFNSRGSRNVS